MKKFLKVLVILATISLIVLLAVQWYLTHNALKESQFHEGTVVQTESGGIVTVANDWIVYQSDDFIKQSSDVKAMTIADIYCDLHKCELMKASQGSYSKLIFTKTITVSSIGDSTEKVYYLVGSYYVTSPDTPVVSDSDSSQEIVEEG